MVNPDGKRTTYLYTAVGTLSRLINADGEQTTFTYDAIDREVQKKLDNGTWTSLTYDDAGRLERAVNYMSDDSVITSFDYGYDAVGNRTNVAEADGERVTWIYDNASQLLSERRSGSDAYVSTFAYDAVGNRTRLEEGAVVTTSIYDAANRLVWSDNGSGRTSYSFDSSGNQRSIETPARHVTNYSWRDENEGAGIEQPLGDLVTYTYAPVTKDADEFRVETESPSAVTRHFWDRHNIVWETDDVGTVDAEYTLAPKEYGDLVSQRRGADSSFYHFDALGSASALSDNSETVTDSYFYKAFGDVLSSTGSTETPFQWLGRLGYYYDSTGGLYSIRRRSYDAAAGRFNTEDPLRFGSGMPNPYTYAENSPITFGDPSGLDRMPLPVEEGGNAGGTWLIGGKPATQAEVKANGGNGTFRLSDGREVEFRCFRPDFSPYVIDEQEVPIGKADKTDIDRADSKAGRNSRREGLVWHHAAYDHCNGKAYMQLIDAELHTAIGHEGAAADKRNKVSTPSCKAHLTDKFRDVFTPQHCRGRTKSKSGDGDGKKGCRVRNFCKPSRGGVITSCGAFFLALLDGATLGEAAEGTLEGALDLDPFPQGELGRDDMIRRPLCPEPLLECDDATTFADPPGAVAGDVKVTVKSLPLGTNDDSAVVTDDGSSVFVLQIIIDADECHQVVEVGVYSISRNGVSDVYRWGHLPQERVTDWPEYYYFKVPFVDAMTLQEEIEKAFTSGASCFNLNDWFVGNGVLVEDMKEVPFVDPAFPGPGNPADPFNPFPVEDKFWRIR